MRLINLKQVFRILVAVGALAVTSTAAAVNCSSGSGTVSNYGVKRLGLQSICCSEWSVNSPRLSYYARRYRSDLSISYEHYVSGGGYWWFDNPSDAWRRTGLQLASQYSAAWWMLQRSYPPDCS
jgi:hypothetical protein